MRLLNNKYVEIFEELKYEERIYRDHLNGEVKKPGQQGLFRSRSH